MTTARTLAHDLTAAADRYRRAAAGDQPAAELAAAADTLASIAEAAAEVLRGAGTVHLVGIEAIDADPYDMDSTGTPREVLAGFTDPGTAQRWADHRNATVPWTAETKTVLLGQVPHDPGLSVTP